MVSKAAHHALGSLPFQMCASICLSLITNQQSQLAAPQQGGLRVKYSPAAAFFFFFGGKADTILLGGCGKSK